MVFQRQFLYHRENSLGKTKENTEFSSSKLIVCFDFPIDLYHIFRMLMKPSLLLAHVGLLVTQTGAPARSPKEWPEFCWKNEGAFTP